MVNPEHKIMEESWGWHEVLHSEGGKRIEAVIVKPGESMQKGHDKDGLVQLSAIAGCADVDVNGKSITVHSNVAIDIPYGENYRVCNKGIQAFCAILVQHKRGAAHSGGDEVSEVKEIAGIKPGMEYPVTICEIGCNHKGDINTALEMIKVAAQFCKTDIVKFQKRHSEKLLTAEEYNAPHPDPSNSYGETYGEHREFLEFSLDQHRALKDACEDWGIVYSTSVWDLPSAREIASLNPVLIKIPSAINTNRQVLEYLYRNYDGEIHISLGMTTRDEEKEILALSEKHGRSGDVILYHCISGYPVNEEELYLKEIRRLRESYGDRVKAVGFSGHHRGIAADIAALTLGAEYFERHFTLDRTWKGTDHAASLEPGGFRKLVRDLKEVGKALRYKNSEIENVEIIQRKKLKRFISS